MKKNLFRAIIAFILAGISMALGIIMIPKVTDVGNTILLIVIGVILLIYVYYYLLVKVAKKSSGVVLILTLIEMIVLTIVAVTCILSDVLNMTIITEGVQILGLAFWIRGVVESFRAYYYRGSTTTKYPVYKVFLNVTLITVGTWFFISSIVSNAILVWSLAVVFVIASIALIIWGILKLKK